MIKIYLTPSRGSSLWDNDLPDLEKLLNDGWKIQRVDNIDSTLIYILEKTTGECKEEFGELKPCKICGNPTYFENHIYCKITQGWEKEIKISIFKSRISTCCKAPVISQDFEDGNCAIWCGECGKRCGFEKISQED